MSPKINHISQEFDRVLVNIVIIVSWAANPHEGHVCASAKYSKLLFSTQISIRDSTHIRKELKQFKKV